jgi:heme exporter protein D
MMPELGRYAVEVTLAYAVTLGLLALLVGWIWARGRKTRQQLQQIESRQGK